MNFRKTPQDVPKRRYSILYNRRTSFPDVLCSLGKIFQDVLDDLQAVRYAK